MTMLLLNVMSLLVSVIRNLYIISLRLSISLVIDALTV